MASDLSGASIFLERTLKNIEISRLIFQQPIATVTGDPVPQTLERVYKRRSLRSGDEVQPMKFTR
jgi:hypothetical protein